MLCPTCHRKVKPLEALFSMLPWWMSCRGCHTKLKLVNIGDFWEHLSYFLFIALATWFMFAPTELWAVWEVLVIAETFIFITLLTTVLLQSYGLESATK